MNKLRNKNKGGKVILEKMKTYEIDGFESQISKELVDYLCSMFECKIDSLENFFGWLNTAEENYNHKLECFGGDEEEFPYSIDDFEDDEIWDIYLKNGSISIEINASNRIIFTLDTSDYDIYEFEFEYHKNIYKKYGNTLTFVYQHSETEIMNFMDAFKNYINSLQLK